MILSLDSNVLVDLMRGSRPHVRARTEQALGDGVSLKVSAVVVHELVLGAHRSARPQHHLGLLQGLLDRMSVEPWAIEDAVATAELRATLETTGRGVGAYDTMIAGQALARSWTLVTADVADFRRFPGLPLIDWSDPAAVRTYPA